MKCELEFLAVGNASKAGDSIIVRYGEPNDYKLMLIDGGHAETGEAIVKRLRERFGYNPVLEHVVLTHSDGDHASGLRSVLEEIQVNHLWLHMPWLLAEEARDLFLNPAPTVEGLRRSVRAEYGILTEIVNLADAKTVPKYYPFAGCEIGPFRVLSPTRATYRYLLPQFDRTPSADQAAIAAAQMWLGKESFAKRVADAARARIQQWMTETWEGEKLLDGGITSASNETSVVLYGTFETGPVLLTGDAGNNALRWAADYADALQLPLQQFAFMQVPHHGSRRNIGPTALNRLLGPPQARNAQRDCIAIVSAPKDDIEHPRQIVMNAFVRRCRWVGATHGRHVLWPGGFPQMAGISIARQTTFSERVEAYT